MIGRRALVIALVALGALLVVAPVSAATGSPFTGKWVSTDTDGSHQTLVVSSGRSPSVVYQDFYASGCDTFGGPATHWVSAGKGTVDGDTLWVAFHKSGCGRFLQGGYGDALAYDPGTDTLVDTFGIIWDRA